MALQERLGRNKTILANFSYLSLLQVFAILFPLLTYPYLLRVIGLELYGVIIFAQSIINYVSLVINFGFNMSGARNVAIYKQDRARLSRIVTSIYWCKFILWLVCLVLYLSVISMVPFFEDHYWVYVLSFLLTFNELLLPIWFFQGIEKMKYITFVNLSAACCSWLLYSCLSIGKRIICWSLVKRDRGYTGGLSLFIYRVGKRESKVFLDAGKGIAIGL